MTKSRVLVIHRANSIPLTMPYRASCAMYPRPDHVLKGRSIFDTGGCISSVTKNDVMNQMVPKSALTP